VGKSTLSAPVHITVNADLPTVTINSPTEGQVFPIPAIVTIQADVKKGSGAITKVQFYGDHRLLEPLTKDPTKDSYSFDWKKVPAGSHTVMVRVTDEFGLRATATVNFKVENKPPVVTLVQPEKGKNFAAHADITLEANASDPDDAIKQVSFWANNRSLGSVSSSPYTLVWKNVPAGLYSLKATATDVNGLKSASIPVLISVSK
jgi:hypothetical protein